MNTPSTLDVSQSTPWTTAPCRMVHTSRDRALTSAGPGSSPGPAIRWAVTSTWPEAVAEYSTNDSRAREAEHVQLLEGHVVAQDGDETRHDVAQAARLGHETRDRREDDRRIRHTHGR